MKPKDPNEKPGKTNRPVEEFVIKSYGLGELRLIYGVNRHTFDLFLEDAEIDLKGRRILSPNQVEQFVKVIGLPKKEITD